MLPRPRKATFLLLTLAVALFHVPLEAQPPESSDQEEEWTWKDGEGVERTKAEFFSILNKARENSEMPDFGNAHLAGATLREANLRGANLSGANLSGANLIEANLTWADLSGAILSGAYLREAILNRANLSQANLSAADLSGVNLREANLRGAILSGRSVVVRGRANFDGGAILTGADLRGADLSGANLRGANLHEASLRGAVLNRTILSGANLSKADLAGADLAGAFFEPVVLIEPRDIARADGISRLVYGEDPNPLVQLKRVFREAGFQHQAKEVAAALRRHDQSRWELVLFDWTSEYGSNPTRALLLVVALLVPCTILYLISLHTDSDSGLYLLATEQRVSTGKEQVNVTHLRHHPASEDVLKKPGYFQMHRYHLQQLKGELRTLSYAFLFSLMSTFNIGFRGFNFGRWIRLVMTREFDMKADGWPRAVSGVQSLLSVGLLALAILSYFGDPFG